MFYLLQFVVILTFCLEAECLSVTTEFRPVSYTHLDVYKRQIDMLKPHCLGLPICNDSQLVNR